MIFVSNLFLEIIVYRNIILYELKSKLLLLKKQESTTIVQLLLDFEKSKRAVGFKTIFVLFVRQAFFRAIKLLRFFRLKRQIVTNWTQIV